MSNEEMLKKYEEEMALAARRAEITGASSVLQTNAGVFQRGDIFEAETIRGTKNYIIFMFLKAGHVYYCHADKGKKVKADHFQKLIDYGDLVPVPREKADPEKLSLSVLGLMAMDNGLSFNDYMKVIWGEGEGSEAGSFVKEMA